MPQWAVDIVHNFAAVGGEMSPYLLLGFLVAGVLSVLVSAEKIEKHLGGSGFLPVLKASAFGVPLPLCSCSVIPVAASLRTHGAGRGATTAFLVSTPQTGADSIAATFSLLGPVFAVFRPLVAFFSGILGGSVVSMVAGGDSSRGGETNRCEHECCSHGHRRNPFLRIARYGFITLPRDIGPALLIGLVVAALISALVPENFFSDIVPPGPLQIAVMMIAGIPVYICATASIPVAAGLIVAGVSPGAAFALLMTGPATNGATVVTVWRVMGGTTCLLYLATMCVAAFGGGLLLDQLVTTAAVRAAAGGGFLPGWFKVVSAVILAGILGYGILHRLVKAGTHDAGAT